MNVDEDLWSQFPYSTDWETQDEFLYDDQFFPPQFEMAINETPPVPNEDRSQQFSDTFIGKLPYLGLQTPLNLHSFLAQSKNDGINRTRVLQKQPKRPVDLNPNAAELKRRFYGVFITHKKFKKSIVKLIHNNIIKDELISKYKCSEKEVVNVTREQERRIDLYFNYYSEYKDQIIEILLNHKKEIMSRFLEGKVNERILK